jgi:hypothetical protein
VSAAQGGRSFGLSDSQVADLWRRADALLNLTGATLLREPHLRVPVRIYLETDPVLPQVEVAQGRQFTIDLLAAHTHHFTYGENLGAPDCGVPVVRFNYLPTRQPIVLDWWTPEAVGPAGGPGGCSTTVASWAPEAVGPAPGPGGCFTTVASWQQSGKDLEWNGEVYTWSKHLEFLKFIDLPRRSGQAFELALACGDPEVVRLLNSHGWAVRDALALSRDLLPYRAFIAGSRGEFTVAKDQNIRLRSGWFSDRSACYLAAGRPVITQDTGFGNVLPVGEGLFAFDSMEAALAALEAVRADYPRHSRAARAVAEECFAAEKVLKDMLEPVGL